MPPRRIIEGDAGLIMLIKSEEVEVVWRLCVLWVWVIYSVVGRVMGECSS